MTWACRLPGRISLMRASACIASRASLIGCIAITCNGVRKFTYAHVQYGCQVGKEVLELVLSSSAGPAGMQP